MQSSLQGTLFTYTLRTRTHTHTHKTWHYPVANTMARTMQEFDKAAADDLVSPCMHKPVISLHVTK